MYANYRKGSESVSWTPTNLPTLTGVYTRFEDRTTGVPQGGPRGIVAIPIKQYDGTAESGKVYEIERMSQANELFGADNVKSIRLIFEHGANKIIAYTLPEDAGVTDYDDMFDLLLTIDFNVFVFDGDVDADIRTSALLFADDGRNEDKHFFVVFGGTAEDDEDVSEGIARSELLEDDYAVNLINGIVRGEDVLSSGEFAAGIAGLIAGNPANETVTYKNVLADDVSVRLRKSELVSAIESGSLALISDGGVKVEKGITTSGDNIRSVQTRHMILNDVPRFLKRNVIAKIDNNEDGRETVRSMIARYMEGLAQDNIVNTDPGNEPAVYVDPENPPTKDAAFFVIEYTDMYSMERIFLTVVRRPEQIDISAD